MRIAFLGDIALIGKYDLETNPNAKDRLTVLAEKLKEFDYVVANLESPLTEETQTSVCKSMHLKTPTKNIELLKYLHVNAVSLANNHIYDFGKKGFEDTISILESNKIQWFGANSKSLIKEFNGNKVCFSGFCCYSTNGTGYIEGRKVRGINTLTYDNIMRQIDNDLEHNAFSIFSFHWGTEHTNYPKYEHICLAEAIAMKKNVIIHGHHPHIIQGVQKINRSIVAYSVGNCLFDDCTAINGTFTVKQNANNKKSFILEVEIEGGEIAKSVFHGFKDEYDKIELFNFSEEIRQISEPLGKIEDIFSYEAQRKEQFDKAILDKFGKHDIKWLFSRLNYHSIGARISAIFRNKKYVREAKKFLGGRCNE